MTCSLFGHRDLKVTYSLVKEIYKLVNVLVIKLGIDTFYFGGFGKFDDLCWKVTSRLRKKLFPHIKRVYCLEDSRYLRPSKRPNYLKDDDYEEYIYLEPSFDYWYTRIYFRNCEMVNNSDMVVFYATEKQNSGAYKMLQYCIKKKKPFINLV